MKWRIKIVPIMLSLIAMPTFSTVANAEETIVSINTAKPSVVVSTNRNQTEFENVAVSTYTVEYQNVESSLKQQLIAEYVDKSATLTAENIDEANSSLNLSSYDFIKSSVQSVIATGNIVDTEGNVLQSIDKTINIQINVPQGLSVVTHQEEVTIDYGSTFDYTANITPIADVNNNFPTIVETDDVDVNNEGTYTCTVTATNLAGEITTVSYKVNVKKSVETLRAEAELQAQQEAEEKAKQEKIAEEQAQQQALQQAQASVAISATTPASTAVATSSGDSDIVSYARQFIGCSYVYGGNDPLTGVDCSGFTKYVYAHFGISLNRVASAQTANGTLVSAEQAQPGDLVIWSGHVGIYSGNGMMINAENPSSGVRESNISYFMNGSSGTFLGYYHVTG